MLGKNYNYKWFDLSDLALSVKREALQDVVKDAAIRGNTFPFANSFGSSIGPRIAESRLFTFEGEIHEIDPGLREERWAELSSIFKIESNLSADRFFDLNWQTKFDDDRTSKAMVFSPLRATNDLCNPIIEFNFELVSNDPRVYDPNVITVVGGPAQIGWQTLAFTLPQWLDSSSWFITCTHEGDWEAPCKIRVEGEAVNPKVLVFQNGELIHFFKLDTTTTDLIIDNTNTTGLTTNERFVVTDNGVSIKQFRRQQWGGGPLFIWAFDPTVPGSDESQVAVLIDNYAQNSGNVTVTIEYRNTYSH